MMIFFFLYRKKSKNPVFEMAQDVGTEWGERVKIQNPSSTHT